MLVCLSIDELGNDKQSEAGTNLDLLHKGKSC